MHKLLRFFYDDRFLCFAFVFLLTNICCSQQKQHQNGFVAASVDNEFQSKAHSNFQTFGIFSPALTEFSTHTVIRPQLHHGKSKRAIASSFNEVDGLHLPELQLTYYHQGQKLIIDLKRNDDLLPDEHFLRYQNSNTTKGYILKNFTKTEIDLCHYKGIIRGRPTSSVAISTCNGGVNGMVFDGNEIFFIHSGSDGLLQDEHFLFRHADFLNKNTSCGYNGNDDHTHDHRKDFEINDDNSIPNRIDGSEFNRILRYKRSYDESNVLRGPYNANKHSSYVELVIVVDNKVYQMFSENTKKVHQHCKELANIVNALYVPLNIFVALVGVVIWNESNEIEFSSDGDVTLRNFLNYRRTKLVLEHPNDNAQLLTKEQFTGGVVGKALKGPICTHEYSGGVSMQHSQVPAIVATTMAHEMGHNFGMEHDTADCKCQDEKCIMSASSTSVIPVHWSSCSIDQLNIAFSRGMNYCLRNKPTKLFDSPECGNGFVEPGEQCDCGLPSYCENTCCDPNTCMLHTNASCATGECCDLSTCKPKVAGTTCRESDNECDLPEYCTGESEYCPTDVFKKDTEECDNGNAYCFQGNCRSHSNQCRILWGPTGESSEHCYFKNIEGIRGGNCGYNRLNSTFIPCDREDVACGMLHCRHLNERLEFGMESAAVLSHSFINHKGSIVPCRTALVDLGLQTSDPGLTPNGAKCGDDKMCVNQKCRPLEQVRAEGMGRPCNDNCNDQGACNSRGHCHCNIGYGGPTCREPGPGGSEDSGPATNPNSHEAFRRFIYIFFLGVIPIFLLFCVVVYRCRNHPIFIGGKLAENIIKTAGSGNKTSSQRPQPSSSSSVNSTILTKSTPSSTDDMNSALLKSPSDPNDVNGLYGKFKGFTLRPLNDSNAIANNLTAPNIAYVHPTVQEANGVPQRAAPPPPANTKGTKISDTINKLNGTLANKTNAISTLNEKTGPALPPPNPGSSARPLISKPVLENSTSTLTLTDSRGDHSPVRPAPEVPVNLVPLKPAPPPPIPLHADPKLNLKRDGTIRRIASFLKKDDRGPAKEKTYIDREKLRNLEISAPMPVAGPTESSNSDSEATSPKEDETKNLVKRTQSMRSPTKKSPNIHSFGSMRQSNGNNRPKSIVNVTSRPKSPPPRPPPSLKKTNSTTSSGYQLPISNIKSTNENTYDDCEFNEISQQSSAKSSSHDNIYSVIDEIPPAAQTLKRSDFIGGSSNSDMGLLGEIVNEIEKRNGESLYTAGTLKRNPTKTKDPPLSPVKPAPPPPAKLALAALASKSSTISNTPGINDNNKASPSAISNSASTYLRPAPINAPVARVAPTRSDLPPATAFSSFKPQNNTSSSTVANSTVAVPTVKNTKTGANSSVNRNKSFGKSPTNALMSSNKTTLPPTTAASKNLHAATIQKPKPLSAKPSFSNNNQKKVAPGAPKAPTTVNNSTNSKVASLSQRFEKK